MKLIYVLLVVLLLTILTSFIPNSLVKGESEKVGQFALPARDSIYAPLSIDADFGMWYIIPGTKKYSGSYFETMARAFPCLGEFKYYGYPFATVRDVCSRMETNFITVIMNFVVFLVLVLLGSYIYGLTKPKANSVEPNRL